MTTVQPIFELPPTRRLTLRRHAIVGLYALSAFWGLTQALEPDHRLLQFAAQLAFATLATLWFSLDRRALGHADLSILRLLFFVTWPVAALLHLTFTRGFRGIAIWLAHAFGMAATMGVSVLLAVLLLYFFGPAGVLDRPGISLEAVS